MERKFWAGNLGKYTPMGNNVIFKIGLKNGKSFVVLQDSKTIRKCALNCIDDVMRYIENNKFVTFACREKPLKDHTGYWYQLTIDTEMICYIKELPQGVGQFTSNDLRDAYYTSSSNNI